MRLDNNGKLKVKALRLFILTFSFIFISTSLWAELNRDSSGVVSDNQTGLAWQDYYGENVADIQKSSWQDALIYCKELSLGNNSDWRLPNIKELRTIVDRKKYSPSIRLGFENIVADGYWSSTTDVSFNSYAWGDNFDKGDDYWEDKTKESYVRCVRGGR